jgi:protein-tyrosine kinase
VEEIREAIERAKASDVIAGRERQTQVRVKPESAQITAVGLRTRDNRFDGTFELDVARLQSKRVIAHNFMDPRSIAFDMLRTQVLQSMDSKEWRIIGVTSPSPGCGKTVTSVNLALSMARLPERSVFLIDLDFRKPQVTNVLGLNPRNGVISVLDGRSPLSDAIMHTCVGDIQLMVLPVESRVRRPSDRMASGAMSGMLTRIQADYRSQIIIVDLPPILSSDDVLAVLPRLDCVLLVTAVGTTTVAEIKESGNHLQSTELVRVVLNKAPRSNSAYYY